ncbi:MAG: Cro/CI family transcriptional regulator [Burkholderiales bacterium]|nr:Cro/CI family transcriptional regulator [Burkholderiales bacterium]
MAICGKWENLVRDAGLDAAIQAAGGVGTLARGLGISQPAVSAWQRIPAERVIAVESLTGVSRATLRPDLYPAQGGISLETPMPHPDEVDDIDVARSREYAMLAVLLGREPASETLAGVASLAGDASPLGMAHIALAEAASAAEARQAGREFFRIFIGVGRGELLPYASYYLTGFVHERPLAHVREDLAKLGITRSDTMREPEDHIAILCETMSGLADGRFPAGLAAQKAFFRRHLQPWASRFFADLESTQDAPFYARVGTVGRMFMEIEAAAFDLDD